MDAFAGDERRVDVGRAGQRRFLNNVSLGLYAALVHRREHHRRRRQALAGARNLWLSLSDQPEVWAPLDGQPVNARVLLVANNDYELSLFAVGERTRLDEGRLHLYTAAGWLPSHEAPGPLEAAVDGEPATLEPPLELAIEPGALRVLLPRPG